MMLGQPGLYQNRLQMWQFCNLWNMLTTILLKITINTFDTMTILVKTIVDKTSLKIILDNHRRIDQSKN